MIFPYTRSASWRVVFDLYTGVVAVSFLACFGGSFLLLGSFSEFGDSPVGTPQPAFYGLTWRHAGHLFISWNLIGLVLLAAWSLVFHKAWRSRNRGRWSMILLNLLLYCLCLVPFVVTGGWFHGWAGWYVLSGCQERLRILYEVLIQYGKEHAGRLPAVDDMDSLLNELAPYLPGIDRFSYAPVDVCAVGGAYERQPKHYLWDSGLAGVHVDKMDLAALAEGKVPVSCPYHDDAESRAAVAEHLRGVLRGDDPNK